MDFKAHLEKVLQDSKWGLVKQDALSPKHDWLLEQTPAEKAFAEAMEEMNRAINLDYYNRFALLFDADFRTKMDYPQSLEHNWKKVVSVGMMQFLYNSIRT